MQDLISKIFFSIFSLYGLLALAALGLYIVALKIRATPFSWVLAVLLGCGAAYAIEFGAEIGFMMAFRNIPFQPWSIFTYVVIAFACLWVSGHAKASRWPISIPCALIAILAIQHGIRADENASTYAGGVTAVVGLICFFIIPKEFKVESGVT